MKRVGYTNFVTFVILFWKLNRKAKQYNIHTRYMIDLPIGKPIRKEDLK